MSEFKSKSKSSKSVSSKAPDVLLPLPPERDAAVDMDVYARFMRYLRHVPNSRMEIKVLSAIQFSADMLDYSDAHIAKLLVDLGLRAPRMAFPAAFLSYADQALKRAPHDVGGPSQGLLDLQSFWNKDGLYKTEAFKTWCAPHLEEGAFV